LQWFASAAVVIVVAAVVIPCSLFYQNRSISVPLSHERGLGTEKIMRKVYVCNLNVELSVTRL
jgi:hypothetical protein